MAKQREKHKINHNQVKRPKNRANTIDRRYMKKSPLHCIRKRSAQKFGLEAVRTLVYVMRSTQSPQLALKAATLLLENARYHTKLNQILSMEERKMKLAKEQDTSVSLKDK